MSTEPVVQNLTDVVEESQLDQFGRDAAERTVELNEFVAEAVNLIVENQPIEAILASLKLEFDGSDADSFDEALGYIVYRGIAEIKRARDSQAKTKQIKEKAKQQDYFAKVFEQNPALIANPEFMSTMLKSLGMIKADAKSTK